MSTDTVTLPLRSSRTTLLPPAAGSPASVAQTWFGPLVGDLDRLGRLRVRWTPGRRSAPSRRPSAVGSILRILPLPESATNSVRPPAAEMPRGSESPSATTPSGSGRAVAVPTAVVSTTRTAAITPTRRLLATVSPFRRWVETDSQHQSRRLVQAVTRVGCRHRVRARLPQAAPRPRDRPGGLDRGRVRRLVDRRPGPAGAVPRARDDDPGDLLGGDRLQPRRGRRRLRAPPLRAPRAARLALARRARRLPRRLDRLRPVEQPRGARRPAASRRGSAPRSCSARRCRSSSC